MMPGDAAVMKVSTGWRGKLAERRAEQAASSSAGAEIVVDHVGDRLRRVRHLAAARQARGHELGEDPGSPSQSRERGRLNSPPKPFMRCAT